MSTWSDIGKGIRNFILDGISFADDAGKAIDNWIKEWAKFGWELLAKWATWIVNWTMDTIDMAWDLVWHTVDAWTALAWYDTNFGTTKWGIDMLWERVHEWTKQMRDMTKSNIGETVVGGLISDGVWLVGEFAAPMWIINKWVKWIKIAKETANALKKSPEAMNKIRALMNDAQKTGKAVEQSQVDEILKSYSIWTKAKVLDNASRVAMKAPDKAQLIELIKNSPDIQKAEMLKNWPKLRKLLVTSPWSSVAIINQIDKLSDNDYEDFVQNIEIGSSDGTPSSKPEVKPTDKPINNTIPTSKDLNPSEWSENNIDNGITIPNSKDFNPSEWSASNNKWFDQNTIDGKKKELELLKEKRAWDLNMATSVVDLMKGLGVDSKQEARKIIFEKMTGKPYTASTEDNIQLKSLIEEAFSKGTLPDYFPSLKR